MKFTEKYKEIFEQKRTIKDIKTIKRDIKLTPIKVLPDGSVEAKNEHGDIIIYSPEDIIWNESKFSKSRDVFECVSPGLIEMITGPAHSAEVKIGDTFIANGTETEYRINGHLVTKSAMKLEPQLSGKKVHNVGIFASTDFISAIQKEQIVQSKNLIKKDEDFWAQWVKI